MPIINHQHVLDHINSQVIEFTDELDIHNLTIDSANELLLNANQCDFKDENIAQKVINDLAKINEKYHTTTGLIISGELDFVYLKPYLNEIFTQISVLVIDFSGFRDGRGYSLAKNLTYLPNYPQKLVLRATGGIIADSLPFLYRVGFQQFDIQDDIFKPSFFEQFESIQHFYDGQNSHILPMFASK